MQLFARFFKKNVTAPISELPLVVRICNRVILWSIYALTALLPIFFAPWSADVLDFNKQALLATLTFIAFFAWIVKVLVSGTISLNINRVHIAAGLLLVAYLLSTIFSVMRYGSIWGWPSATNESFLSVVSFFLLYFIISTTFSIKHLQRLAIILTSSLGVAMLFGVLQLFGLHILPWAFSQTNSFNTIGSVGSLGLILALLLPMLIILMAQAKKYTKIVVIVGLVVSFAMIVMINYRFLWWVILLGMAVVILFGILKRNLFLGHWMWLPMFFLVVSLFFIVLQPQLKTFISVPGEVYLSHGTNLSIDGKALRKSPIVGTGPGTFGYDFAKYKDKSFSQTSLWNVNFSIGSSKMLTSVATMGGLGVLALVIFMLYVIIYAGESLVKWEISEENHHKALLVLWALVGFVMLTLAAFLYNSNITLDYLFFLFAAIIVAVVFRERKTYTLEPSSLMMLSTTFIFTLVFIFGFGFLLLAGQRYFADAKYAHAVNYFSQSKLKEGTGALEQAASINPSLDLYFSQLSQVYVLNIKEELNSKEGTDEEKAKKLQVLVANALNASKIATDLNPNAPGNWAVRGDIFQSMTGLVTDAAEWATKSYDQAIDLDPFNPYLYLQKGIVAYQGKDYKGAGESFQKALDLKPDYVDALYFTGLAYDASDDKAKATEVFTTLKGLLPQEQQADIQKILDNLKAGRKALAGLTQAEPETVPDNPVTPPSPAPETETPPATTTTPPKN